MYIDCVPNRNSPPAVLLRESYREGGKTRKRTLANLSGWPEAKIEALRAVLRNATVVGKLDDAFEIERSLPHGHVEAVLGTLRRLGLDRLIGSKRSKQRDVVTSMIVARVLDPRSKLGTTRALNEATRTSTLGELLELDRVDENDLYKAMDWLLPRQSKIEQALSRRHLSHGSLVLYDVTSTYFEGRHCPLARMGYSRDRKKGKLQIVIGLVCNAKGCPVSVEVFEGNTADPKTFPSQVQKVQDRFALEQVVFVGDRGMITSARIREDLKDRPGVSWITAVRSTQIKQLVLSGTVQLSLFDERDIGEVLSPDYPGERLIACRNPLLAMERKRKRRELLAATEQELDKIVRATRRRRSPLHGKDKIGMRVGRVLGRFKMAKHFLIEIGDASFAYQRDEPKIAQEESLDGIYMLRTSVAAERMTSEDVVRAYKGLSVVERAFRRLKTVDLKMRPIYHRLPDRVRAHVLICMLAYYVEWHMREALAPILFHDDDKARGEAQRKSIVSPAKRSPRALAKANTKTTDDRFPVHSFQTLLADLATICKNRIRPKMAGAESFDRLTTPTELQRKAMDLLKAGYRLRTT